MQMGLSEFVSVSDSSSGTTTQQRSPAPIYIPTAADGNGFV